MTHPRPDDREERRRKDIELVARLRVEECAGMTWKIFCAEEARKAVGLLHSLVLGPDLTARTAELRRPIRLTDDEAALLRANQWDRDDVVNEAVARGVLVFRDNAVLGTHDRGRWEPDGGASLSTYLGNQCIRELPGALQRWRTQMRRRERDDGYDQRAVDAVHHDDPIGRALADRGLDDLLADRPELARLVDRLGLREALRVLSENPGITWSEVAERIGMPHSTLRGRLNRLRDALRRRPPGDPEAPGPDDGPTGPDIPDLDALDHPEHPGHPEGGGRP